MAEPGAGDLTRRILIEKLTQTKDSSGGMVDTWAADTAVGSAGYVWAKVMNLSGNERNATSHGGKVPEARTEFTVRYNVNVMPKHRISYAGKLYDIQHVNNYKEQNKFLILTCNTGVNDGR